MSGDLKTNKKQAKNKQGSKSEPMNDSKKVKYKNIQNKKLDNIQSTRFKKDTKISKVPAGLRHIKEVELGQNTENSTQEVKMTKKV